MIKPFPKIFAIGHNNTLHIFDDVVEVTEKVDGSQFAFGIVNGELKMRSKGVEQRKHVHDSLFIEAVATVCELEKELPQDVVFYCEYLKKPKHNTLTYSNVPRNYLALYGINVLKPSVDNKDGKPFWVNDHKQLSGVADELGIDVVPLIYQGKLERGDDLLAMLDRESFLGGAKVEGVVVKNYAKTVEWCGDELGMMAGKYVSEAFKEVHGKTWKRDHTAKGGFEAICDDYCTEARWHKAIQHLRDAGQLTNDPKDIGPLVKEIQKDITEEELDAIKSRLWSCFGKDLLRSATKGFPEWYKQQLLAGAFSHG